MESRLQVSGRESRQGTWFGGYTMKGEVKYQDGLQSEEGSSDCGNDQDSRCNFQSKVNKIS